MTISTGRRAAVLAAPSVPLAASAQRAALATGSTDRYPDLRLQLQGILGPGQQLRRNTLLDAMYASLPRDGRARVQVYNYEIAPGGRTNRHCHNGATFFVTLQGQFEAAFEEGVLVRAKAGDVYSEPIAKFHQGHNPHPDLACAGIGVQLTSLDREPVTSVPARPW